MSGPWPTVVLGKVLSPVERSEHPVPGQQYRQLGVRLWGEGAYEREALDGGGTRYKALFRVEADDVVVNKIWARNGSVAVVEPKLAGCYVSGEFPTFEVRRSDLDPQWIHWLTKTRSFWAQCDVKSRGTSGKNRIRPERFLEVEIPLPPVAEQQRINETITHLTANIQEARWARQRATRQSGALYLAQLSASMSGDLNSWRKETVANVVVSMDAGWSPRCDDVPAQEGEWGVLKTTAVQWCEFQPAENKRLPSTLRPRSELAVKAGDVLVTRAGPVKRVGVVASVRNDEPRLTISDKLIRLRCDSSKIDYRFLELALASPYSQEHLLHRKTGLADAQVNISQAILRATPITYPALAEQVRLVQYFDALKARLDAVRALQGETVKHLEALLPSILDRAFNGEL